MMKYTPRVRSEIAPMTSAASADDGDRGRPGDPQAGDAFGDEDADDVGAGAEERGVAEGHHAAVAEHQVEAGRRHGVDQDAAGEADVEELVRAHCMTSGKAIAARITTKTLLHPRAGNRPCGRKNSTAAIRT